MIKFERTTDRWGDPVYTATLTPMEGIKQTLAVIEKGEWIMPKRVRYEVYYGERKAPGAFPDTYQDTLADAKEVVLLYVYEILRKHLPQKGEDSVKTKKLKKKKA